MMELDDFVDPGLAYLAGLFPKTCRRCDTTFPDYAAFVRQTEVAGVVCYDHDVEDPDEDLVGTLGYANCVCGNTLVLSSDQADDSKYRLMVEWMGAAAAQQGTTTRALLEELGRRIRARALERPSSADGD
jgi:hypothetical protein